VQGQDPPLRKDEDLPDWLWKLAAPDKTLNELRRLERSELSAEQVRPLRWLCRMAGLQSPSTGSSVEQAWQPLTQHLLPSKSFAQQVVLRLQLARYVKLENRDGIRLRNHSRSK
jgi:hypothetical protein